MKTTCASKILENFVPFYDATAVTRITDAGMVILGKTNMDEFAMGSTTETSAFQVTRETRGIRNTFRAVRQVAPVRRSLRVSALRLSAPIPAVRSVSQVPTAASRGSSRHTEPSPRFGLVAYASSLDQIGPVGKNAADCAALLETITSHDEKDSTSMEREDTDFTSAIGKRCPRHEDRDPERVPVRRS